MDDQNLQQDDGYDFPDAGAVFGDEVDPDMNITWRASEYIHHHKSSIWFIMFGLVTALLTTALFFILRDISVVVLSIVMSIALVIYANRRPQTLNYTLNNLGLSIGENYYSYSDFHSFSIMEVSGILSIELVPLQRFRPSVSIYFDSNDAEKIIGILGSFLPEEQKTPDLIDRLIRFVRF